MKLTNYSQQITNVSGSSTPKVNNKFSAQAAKTDAVDITPITNAAGKWAETINKIHEQEDNETVMRAMDAYNKAKFDNMYNDQTGVMNTLADGASNAVKDYGDNEQKYRGAILEGVKLHSQAKRVALDNMLNNSAQQGYQQVARHQFTQVEKWKDLNLQSGIQTQIEFAQKNYNDSKVIDNVLGNVDLLTSIRYSGVAGSEAIMESAKRNAYGMVISNVIQSAMDKEDYAMADAYNEKYGSFLTPEQRRNIGKVIYNKAKSRWESNFVKDAYAKYGKDVDAFVKSLDGSNGFNMSKGSSNLTKEMTDMIGKIGYYDGKGGTNCARTIGMLPSLKGTVYEGETWVPSFMQKAKDRGEWHQGTEGMRPGDLVVVNGDNHLVMMDDNGGTIQNGASGDNGKGGVYKSQLSPSEMFNGNVTGYIRVGGGENSTAQPMSEEEKESLKKQYMTYVSNQVRIKNLRDDQVYNDFSKEVYGWVSENTKDYASAREEARKRAGSDPELLKTYINTVDLWYKDYNKKPSKSGANGGKGTSTVVIDQAKMLLRNGQFNNQEEYVSYIQMNGGNAKQLWQANQDYNDFKKSAGEFKFDLGGMVSGAISDEYAGANKLSGADKAALTAGVRIFVGKKIAEFRMKEKRDPYDTEVATMIDDALVNHTFTYQTPGKYFKAWLSDTEFNLNGGNLGAMGIEAIEKANGYDDLYNVRMDDGRLIQMSGARLQAMKNGQGYRG